MSALAALEAMYTTKDYSVWGADSGAQQDWTGNEWMTESVGSAERQENVWTYPSQEAWMGGHAQEVWLGDQVFWGST